jgi:hypothetical protein
LNDIKSWANRITSDDKTGAKKMLHSEKPRLTRPSSRIAHAPTTTHARAKIASESRITEKPSEEIPPSERQKLRALIRELNGPQTN